MSELKPVYHYSDVIRCKAGVKATLFVTDHPDFDPEIPTFTTTVLAFHEKTGVIETENIIFMPEK